MQNIEQSESRWPIELYKLIIIAASVACLVLTFVVAQSEKEFIISLLGTMCLIVISIPLFAQKPISVFEPIVLVSLLVLIGTPVKLIYIFWVRQTDPYIAEHVLLHQEPEVFLKGAYVLLVGYSLFVFGYMLRFPKTPLDWVFLPRVVEWNGKRLQIVFFIVGGIALLSFAAFVVTSGVSFSSLTSLSQKRFLEARADGAERMHSTAYLFCRGAAFSKFIVYFCLIWIIHNKKSFLSLMGLVMVCAMLQSISLAVVLNSRAGVALVLLDCAVISYYMYRQVSVKLMLGSLTFASCLMIAMLFARGQRNEVNINSMGMLFQKTLNGRNMLDISKCCHIINGVPRKMDFRKGEMLYAWMAAPIPKKYWPDKPIWANQGLTVNRKIFGYRGDLSGVPPGLIGELHWNFGVGGVWVGLFCAGLLFRQIFLSFYPHRYNPTSILIYTMIATRFVIFSLGNDLGTGIVKAGLDLAPIYMILLFIGMVRGPAQASLESADASEQNSFPQIHRPLELTQ
jgi:hypothetical protein